MKAIYQVAMDGPAGAGKSSVAKALARRLGCLYLDTGAMYRAVGLHALKNGIDPSDEAAASAMMQQVHLEVTLSAEGQTILLNGEDVTNQIRTEEVSCAASDISRWPAVRSKMVALQREIAQRQSVVVDGRDICTRVLPQATYKFYLTASIKERAKRRFLQLQERGGNTPIEEIEENIRQRDQQDMNRETDPLRRAPGAVRVDTTRLNKEQVLDLLEAYIRENDFTQESKFQRGLYGFAKFVCRGLVKIVSPYRIDGPVQPNDLHGPVILCMNHVAKWDAVLAAVLALPRRSVLMAKGQLFENRLLGWLLRTIGGIPVRRGESDTEAIHAALNKLSEGRVFIIFPEGTRCKAQDGSMGPLQPGAALLSMRSGAPILPIYVEHGGKYRFGHKVVVHTGEFLDLQWANDRPTNSKLLAQITEQLTNEMERLRNFSESRKKD